MVALGSMAAIPLLRTFRAAAVIVALSVALGRGGHRDQRGRQGDCEHGDGGAGRAGHGCGFDAGGAWHVARRAGRTASHCHAGNFRDDAVNPV
jgi:hypothetical protein